MELSSPAFGANQPIPDAYTARGTAFSPPLAISNIPAGTQSLLLIVHDPDAPGGDFTHWTLWNISATATLLPENHTPSGSIQGLNDFGNIGYGAPAPPSGTHHYVFDLYALNTQLSLPAGASRTELEQSMEGHTIAQTQLIGIVNA
jgi:Raf kinase inhibitor-like YbhB/YbcL family protein